MFKQLFTLARGRSTDASNAFLDANAISLLRQQMREAAQGVEKSRKAVTIVMAYAEREKTTLSAIVNKIKGLEDRAIKAIEMDCNDLALEAATAIANLEAEKSATQQTIDKYTSEITRLRHDLSQSEAMLTDLKRGQRIAEATDKTQKLRGDFPVLTQNDLADASTTLKRLQERHEHSDATMAAMTELSATTRAETLTERMANAGIRSSTKITAQDVLARLKKT